ncbi:hypothetical protein RHSIM_Rhsim05G0135700 [Rhododendron simsii]|uniref:Single-stranded DNA-binding protein, mitochondrial n=1 Tax=Rhododendron simsii TaxID=118357 RepID=A0A834LPU6_RHOSS|nr:hypothetical protein RHSIM_Rhsim05G0135700 [Rhododendron simsii]
MGSVAARFTKLWRFPEVGIQGSSKLCYSTVSDVEETEKDGKNNNEAQDDDFFVAEIPELQSVDPRRGRRFRGVHKAILCGKVGQDPVQKILRDGRTVTIFTVGTGGMFDQRIEGARDLPRPAQWHRIAVHNEHLGAYAVQQLVKNSPVYVEGDIETRVYNDSSGEIKDEKVMLVESISCVVLCTSEESGKLHLVKTGESISSINFEELREGLL